MNVNPLGLFQRGVYLKIVIIYFFAFTLMLREGGSTSKYVVFVYRAKTLRENIPLHGNISII
jgi:hypothetical protein